MYMQGYKLIKQGQISYAPKSAAIRQYYEEWNDLIRRRTPQHAEREMVTILDATPQEVEEYLMPKVKEGPKSAKVSQADENSALREQMAQMQQQMIMMQGLLLKNSQTDSPQTDSLETEQPKRAGRPPKPKEDEK